MEPTELALAALIFLAALLYSSVGHGGASGYLAAMALLGVAPAIMKPAALVLNVFVALIATHKFYSAGAFSWRLFWPFAIASVPFAYLGGTLSLPDAYYKPLVGLVLLYSAWRFLRAPAPVAALRAPPPLPALMAMGAGLGLLSGLTGVGGGIFLSPLLLFFRLADMRVVSGVAAAFIVVNSLAGLLGVMQQAPSLPEPLPLWAGAAVAGGWLGAEYGSRHLATRHLRRLLGVVLLIAGAKMLLTV